MRPSSSLLVISLLTTQSFAFAIPNPFARRYATTVASQYSSGDSTQGSGSYEQASQTYDNGQWEPTTTAAYGTYPEATSSAGSWQEGATATAATWDTATESAAQGLYPTSETYALTSAPVETSAAAQGSANWETQVTWPAGCESWANPCPAGAHISGGSTAGGANTAMESGSYTNAFTSYTTMTNSEGVITGQPSKATVAAGVISSSGSTLQTVVASGSQSTASGQVASSGIVTPTGSSGSSTSSNEFSVNTASSSVKATFATGAAVPKKASLGGAALVGAAGVVVALL